MTAWSMLLVIAAGLGVIGIVSTWKWFRLRVLVIGREPTPAAQHSSLYTRLADLVDQLDDDQRQRFAERIGQCERDRLRWIWASCFFVAVIAGVGLCLPDSKPIASPNPGEPSLPSVQVLALERTASSVLLETENASLANVLAKAGVALPQSSGDQNDQEPLLVAVKRTGDHATVIRYFPASLVESGFASHVEIQDGDQVSLRTLDQTSLGVLQATRPGVPFQVEGLIARPGQYKTQEVDEVIMNVHSIAYGQEIAFDESGPDLMIIQRQASDNAATEKFYVPLRTPYADEILLDSRIQAGDVIRYARAEQEQ